MARVLLVDDHEVVRVGVRELLNSADDLDVVGEAGSAAEALARMPDSGADVPVLDVRLPDGNGIELCRELRSRVPDLKCLMLTSFTDDEALFDARSTAALLDRIRREREEGDPVRSLTEQERTVFDYIGEGLTNKQIAEKMFLAEKPSRTTPHTCWPNSASNAAQAAVLATRLRKPSASSEG
ncbi:response regulator transcription factor [Saccharothrix sp. 6-C]|nr:response regulator transcription factor [Saccharothrix sp. 6-C]